MNQKSYFDFSVETCAEWFPSYCIAGKFDGIYIWQLGFKMGFFNIGRI